VERSTLTSEPKGDRWRLGLALSPDKQSLLYSVIDRAGQQSDARRQLAHVTQTAGFWLS
jgi:hypothetical protein